MPYGSRSQLDLMHRNRFTAMAVPESASLTYFLDVPFEFKKGSPTDSQCKARLPISASILPLSTGAGGMNGFSIAGPDVCRGPSASTIRFCLGVNTTRLFSGCAGLLPGIHCGSIRKNFAL